MSHEIIISIRIYKYDFTPSMLYQNMKNWTMNTDIEHLKSLNAQKNLNNLAFAIAVDCTFDFWLIICKCLSKRHKNF